MWDTPTGIEGQMLAVATRPDNGETTSLSPMTGRF
jgi:hypothetical protein